MKLQVYVHQFQNASSKNLLPLSAALLTSYALSKHRLSNAYEFHIVIARRDPVRVVGQYREPDVLAFSTYSWNYNQSLAVAELGKAANPGSLVVFGAP